jgi:hypothetical protein
VTANQKDNTIIHGEHVLQELRLLEVANAARLPRQIQLVRHGVGPEIEVVVVLRLVNAHAPQYDRRMIPVPPHHPAHVVDGDQLPRLIPNVLPAGNLLEHQQPDLVAGVQKMPRLRIVRGAHDVAPQVLPQNLCVLPLRATRHGLPNPRKGLVTVQPAQLHHLAVQLKAVIGKGRLAKSDPPRIFIHNLAAMQQPHPHRVKLGMMQVP